MMQPICCVSLLYMCLDSNFRTKYAQYCAVADCATTALVSSGYTKFSSSNYLNFFLDPVR